MNEIEKKKLVLVVDDQQQVLRFVEIDLKLRGFDVLTTTSGAEALEIIKSKEPDIMLLDVIMPEIDGLEVLKQLRAFSQLPVIAFSANTGVRHGALRLGANSFMVKPFHPDNMARKIRGLLSHQ